MANQPQRICTKCGIPKPLETGFAFRKDVGRYRTICRSCSNSRQNELNAMNPARWNPLLQKVEPKIAALDEKQQFSDPDIAHDFFVRCRWPTGVICPHCESKLSHCYLKKYRRWKCGSCKKQFTAKTGTDMEDSPLALNVWLKAIYVLSESAQTSALI